MNKINIKPSFCFISNTGRVARPILDPSVRYRCYHPADELQQLGYFSIVTSYAEFIRNPVYEHDFYIFHRPSRHYNSASAYDSLINELKSRKKILIADYDDLIFGDEDIARESSIVKNGHASLADAVSIFSNNLAGLKFFDKVITSTKSLKEKASEYNKLAEVNVIHNFIPSSLLDLYGNINFHKMAKPKGTIGYFAGTKSHDKDILIILDVLHRVLSENEDFTLLVVGPVAIPSALANLPNVYANSVVDYFRLPSLMQQCETVIAPLEESVFNNCKSRVKFLESSLAGCRLIATPITDMIDIGTDYISLAKSKDDWYKFLSKKLTSDEHLLMTEKNFTYLKRNNIELFLKIAGVEK